MTKKTFVLSLFFSLAATMFAQEGAVPKGIPNLNHVWVIMMENHGFSQVLKNPAAPFTTKYAHSANLATNYFAVAHPSLTNYLETNGGSNFGVLDDNSPNWHSSCSPNISSGVINYESDSDPICPIAGTGTDAATPLLDCFNEVTGPPCDIEIDGVHSYAADANILGISIADQLVAAGKTWKSYQESLPPGGPDLVNNSDGNFSNLTDFTLLNSLWPDQSPLFSSGEIVALYAVKHNPFVYFKSTQEGTTPGNSLANVAAFDGAGGLWGDLASGKVPNYSFIAPNQCNDQHGRGSYTTGGNASPFCGFDPNDNGTQVGLNPALMTLGDQALQKIVTAIHASPAWSRGHNAIITIWDENDYSVAPTINQVAAIVDTNYGFHEITSNQFYTHFSLLRSIEGGFRLPCLNHACDASTAAMTDLFGQP